MTYAISIAYVPDLNDTLTDASNQILSVVQRARKDLEAGQEIEISCPGMIKDVADYLLWAYKKLGFDITFAPDYSRSTWRWSKNTPIMLPRTQFY